MSSDVAPAARSRYSAVAMLLHWLIAGLIITNVWLAWQAEDLHGAAKMPIMQWHKTLGISILVLSLLRLAWRLFNKPPPLSPDLKVWELWLARIVHWGFYVAMIGIPLTGWLMVSATPLIKVYPIHMYGLFDWPAVGFLSDLPRDQMKATHEAFETIHKLAAKIMIYGLFPLHILGALKHQFLDKDPEFARMIPFLPMRK
ncbi:MAG: cytochrome b [Caulobacter sp.]|nr:cytochrome b [Caulobacter sp.]